MSSAAAVEVMEGSCDAAEAAAGAGLRYVSDEQPGISRRKNGRGFSYSRPDGSLIKSQAERKRIAAIAIPPAWTDVWICPSPRGHILATGRDAKGRKQYRYHPRWREVRDGDKYSRLAAFGHALPDVRSAVDGDLGRRGMPREKVLALVVKLLDETLIRVGNDAYAIENESYGLTTLKSEHVDVDGPAISFEFVGKSGLEHERFLDDAQMAKIVRQCHELGGQDLFTYKEAGQLVDVTSQDVNAYLQQLAGSEVTAKHFRTWGGTTVAAASLTLGGPPASDTEAEKQILASFDVAAEVLGNTRTVCRTCYVHPRVPEAYRSGELAEAWGASRGGTWLDRKERTVLALLDS